MIRNVIFDLGGVLLSVDWEVRFRQCGLTGEEKELVRRATIKSSEWLLLDKGADEEAVIAGMVRKEPEAEAKIREFLSDFQGVIRKRDYANLWIHSLKEAGLGIYVLSNFCKKAARDSKKELDFLSQTDGVVFSYEAGMVKPDKEIYQYFLNKYLLKPEECVFIDDRKDNIRAGEEEGIKGILFTSQKQAFQELKELLKIELADVDTQDSRKHSGDSESIL